MSDTDNLYSEINRVTKEHMNTSQAKRAICNYFFGYRRVFKHPTTGQWLYASNWPHFGPIRVCDSWTHAVMCAAYDFNILRNP